MNKTLLENSKHYNDPLPVQLLEPWLKDNEKFQQEMVDYSKRLGDKNITELRAKLTIKSANIESTPSALSAIDAADLKEPFGDRISILVQAVKATGDGEIFLAEPRRVTGINGHEMKLTAMPMRVAEECKLLAVVKEPTIADLSFWSFLTDINQTIIRCQHLQSEQLKKSVRELVEDGTFVTMMQNPFVVSMTKTNESQTFLPGISDRQVLTLALRANEYTAPYSISENTNWAFGIVEKGFTDAEKALLQRIYTRELVVIYYKPHAWSRAYRIEGRIEHLRDEQFTQSLLAAIALHTANRLIIEPWPQFLADFMATKIAGLSQLYGQNNWHRNPEINMMRNRTR
jgi:hypothetical protein